MLALNARLVFHASNLELPVNIDLMCRAATPFYFYVVQDVNIFYAVTCGYRELEFHIR